MDVVAKCERTRTPTNVDIEALRERYRQERDMRVRPEGDNQYIEVSEDFSEFFEVDPYSPAVVRDAIEEDAEVAILGGGFAGLIAGARLKQAGINDIRIIEMGGDFGGTWYWNRYPGVQCDVDAYCYMPLLEEVGYIPKERYSYGSEIFEHCQRIGRHFGLYDGAMFGTMALSLRWDELIQRWRIKTNHGDDIRARFLVMASGRYNRPKLPGIPGIKDFKNHLFHTARWDYDYTGGDTTGGLHKLADKRVAIIGTGATAVQVVPFLGRYAKHLHVFQRTPSSIDARGNRNTDPDWVKTLKPGWQAERQKNFNAAVYEMLQPNMPDLVCDGWTELNRNIQAFFADSGSAASSMDEYMSVREPEDYKLMERIRQRIGSIVHDPETAEKLKPYYRFLCKRPCWNDNYLPTFNRPNVTLVDVSGSRGVERLTEDGIVANGVEYKIDCLVLASGFEIATGLKRRIGIETIEGRDGLSLYDHWASGPKTLHGLSTHGFPNLFFVGWTQGGVSANVSEMYDNQARHFAYIIKETRARGATTVQPSQEAQDAWVRTMKETEISNKDFLSQCTPGYYNSEGSTVVKDSPLGEVYGPGYQAFVNLMEDWRNKSDLDGLIFEK
jgi:cyclohexanone monooxygenase